ncbi:hypothetical protein FAZ95_17810 [Trinickia violacea]|uniref:DUF2273 domain-containing protein n=1 Tax=Trinickia violacea TaxID=2571746 RepID=A0A4P8IUR4_9BURK|nr:hypothetical protein [Trinickia violacea]QCP50844.1 hypothetical protein FAZ95_17810 [Trinickia violacea]
MKLVEDGNLSLPVRTIFVVLGISIGAVSFIWVRSILLMSIGLAIAAIGGDASKAHQLSIKPFDNSYKKARESYKVKGDEED